MATNPINPALPADLPENWVYGDTVSPNGTETGLTPRHGYNYLMQQVNAAQEAVNALGEAMEDVPQLEDGKIPASQLPIGTPGGAASLDESGKVPASQLPPMDYVPTSEKGAAGGVATLDSSGKLKEAQKPTYTAADVGAIANPAGGTTGQVLTKTDGGAAWGDAPQTGITQEQADARYLQLSGGTLNGNLKLSTDGNPELTFEDTAEADGPQTIRYGAGSEEAFVFSKPIMAVPRDAGFPMPFDVVTVNELNQVRWVKAATHSQYDEWHLAVEGGTFVKLVMNVYRGFGTQHAAPNSTTIATLPIDTPTLYFPTTTATNNVFDGGVSGNTSYILIAEINPTSQIECLMINPSNSEQIFGPRINKNAVLIEYFVPST